LSKETKNSSSNNNVSLPLVIVNPKSGGGSTHERWREISSDLRAHFGPYNVAFTLRAGGGIDLAKQGALEGRKFIIACGGDGTINEVANGILQSGKDCELGVFPAGTGGDFRRTLGIPSNPRDAAKSLKTGETKVIDVGKVTFQTFGDETETRYFMNVSSFGLATSIIERVKTSTSLKWIPSTFLRGKTSFALSTLQEVLDLNFTTVRVRVDDGEEKSLNTVNFSVANARFFGGGMKIAPDAKLDDGLLDVVSFGDIKTAKILLNAYTLYRGTHIEIKEVQSMRAKKIEATPADPSLEIHLEVDGELPGKLPAIFEIIPGALRVRIPKSVTR
jgi:YegS/Rv2252/BmrU family lipid kinase